VLVVALSTSFFCRRRVCNKEFVQVQFRSD
jgi:hypothetical protein